MAQSRAATLYKTLKQNGILALAKDGKSITWTPDQPASASPALEIPIQNVSNLQKTPDTAKKAMLKIFAKGPNDADPVDHTFTFTSAEARTEIEAITERIRKLIDEYKKEQLAAAGASGGQSAAMTIANAISGGSRGAGHIWEDDDKLKSDIKLQHALMQEDPQLHRTFVEALSVKPDSISSLQFTQQFWASRVHLLRAYALAQHQDRGRSNVFSEIGDMGGGRKFNVTSEQIHTIFEQYPLVRRVYDELVPRTYSEMAFWRRFFQSQLYLTLRGMKVDDRINRKDENIDSDTYLNAPELTGLRPTAPDLHIPKFIDLEGNEENHSRRQGNKPDAENNQANLENAPVIRKLNALSEKLMAAVRPSDADMSAPIGTMEAEYEQLSLRDLQGDPEQQRITLNIRDQSRFFSDSQSQQSDLNPFSKLNPAKALSTVYNDLLTTFPQPGLNPIPIPPFIEIDTATDDATPTEHSGALHAHAHIMTLIESHRSLTATISPHSTLPPTIYERTTLTHATTIEFLRQFWSAFLSGDAQRASEVAALVDSLIRATERIAAIAQEADDLRASRIKALELEAREKARLTGSKPKRVNTAALESGGEVVRELMRPILESLGKAEQAYRKAYAEQSREAGGEEMGTPQPA